MGKEQLRPSPSILKVSGVNVSSVIRYTILLFSGAAMVLGILVMIGYLVPVNFPSEYGVIFGAVIFLYGLYRFVIAYFQQRGR